MIQVLKSLERISSGYSVFEKDQVLTHDQLNSIASYFDDQTRLTRVKLLGVGIAGGLRVSMQDNTVKVTKGIGITTDGDLLYFNRDTNFDKFKQYNESRPIYSPFYVKMDVKGEMLLLYELVNQETTDDALAISLGEFKAKTGNNLDNMVAILLMESYINDSDLCSSTDCDNLGQNYLNTVKLLLVKKDDIVSLKQTIVTPHQTYTALSEIGADRPLISTSSSIDSFTKLSDSYRSACNTIHSKLKAGLQKWYLSCSTFLADVFPSDPYKHWESRLDKVNSFMLGSSGTGRKYFQYYYDFLKDLVETYNQFHALLFGDRTECCLATENFPKHLLLGNLIPGSDPEENRTTFYPSPIVSQTMEQLNHAKFLAKKLGALIQTFWVPDPTSTEIRVTPSSFEDRSLEERAIPYYYQKEIYTNWNYRLHQRGKDAYNYSYNATEWAKANTNNPAKNPLSFQIGCFSFFRIEGHLGKNVSTALENIKRQIASKSLPFAVCAVMLGTDTSRLVKTPGIRYTDLHRFHYILRQDIYHQLGEVTDFSKNFKDNIENAVRTNLILETESNDGTSVKGIANRANSIMTTKAESLRTKLNQNYSQYKTDTSWEKDLGSVIETASQFKSDLRKVVKTEFTTPFDTLISSTHVQWLNWLDKVIADKDHQEDNKLLFSKFISQHPGIEHFAGVIRGGTFVLVYDNENMVVADFMLPYYCHNTVEEEIQEVVLPKPVVKPGSVLENGISIQSSRENFTNSKLELFKNEKLVNEFVKVDQLGNKVDQLGDLMKTELTQLVKYQLNDFKINQLDKVQTEMQIQLNGQQKEYLTTMKDSINLVSNALVRKSNVVNEGVQFSDNQLSKILNDTKEKQLVVDYLSSKANQAGLSTEKRQLYSNQAKETEVELATTIYSTMEYISNSGIDVSTGSEGFAALLSVSNSLGKLQDSTAISNITTGLQTLHNKTGNKELRSMINVIVGKIGTVR